MRSIFVFFLLTLVLPLMMLVGAAPAAWADVTGFTVEVTERGSEVLKFNANSPVSSVKVFTLSKPERLVIDIPRQGAPGLQMPKDYQGKVLKGIRFGQFDASTARIVFDLQAPVKVVSSLSGNPFVVEIQSTKEGAVATAGKPGMMPLVVIDAGHGGQDPGAIGLHGTHEKDITLNYALRLRDALLHTGRYRVLLTRDSDKFIPLTERVAIARKAKADMFVSFHADSNPNAEAKGLSIYTLSENASDEESAALAERENKADIIVGIDLSAADADVASILIDLTQRETMNKSAVMADAIASGMPGKVSKLTKTHRFAGFRVLKAPDIPSVLIELGFLSNETDERLLLTAEYRDAVIAAVVKGIDRYRHAE